MGRAADRRVAPASRARASCRSPTSRWRARTSTARTACSLPARRRGARRRPRRARSRRSPTPASRVSRWRRTAPRTSAAIFFFAEFATAVAGWALEINPFDQPNVQEAKDNTGKVLERTRRAARCRRSRTPTTTRCRRCSATPRRRTTWRSWATSRPRTEFDEAVAELRAAIRDATKATTTFGYGPRFLHSTGQFHKGGPPIGRSSSSSTTGRRRGDPGAPFTFATLKNAQAIGDLRDAARARPAGRAGAPRGRPRSRPCGN